MDSIRSHEDYGNIKITYENGLLTSYKECYRNGSIHDGEFYNVKYTPDTVYVQNGNGIWIYKAIIGDNGLVSALIYRSGGTSYYKYDDKSHLINMYNDTRITREYTWEDDNIVLDRRLFEPDPDDPKDPSYLDVYYSYTPEENKASILPPCRSYNYFEYVNEILFYSGLIGRGTKNLPSTSYNRYSNGDRNQSYRFSYIFNEDGYVESADQSNGYNRDLYYYK